MSAKCFRLILAVTLCLGLTGLFLAQNAQAAEEPAQGGQIQSFDDYGLDEDAPEQPEIVVNDPLEGWNRFWFTFNDRFYFGIWEPLAKGYAEVTPEPVRLGVKNVFNNLAFPIRFVNCLLQGEFMEAGVEFSSFFLNTTMGGLGLMDVAKTKKKVVEPDAEDLGQTLGSYGFSEGAFLVWPFLGPSSLRDTLGMVGDSFLSPTGYVIEQEAVTYGLKGYENLNETTFHFGEYKALKDAAIDPYISMRQAYIQFRRERVNK